MPTLHRIGKDKVGKHRKDVPDTVLGHKFGFDFKKGDYLDGTDSQAKCRLGNIWAEKAGDNFFYFMIFNSKPVEGAYKVGKAKELIKMID